MNEGITPTLRMFLVIALCSALGAGFATIFTPWAFDQYQKWQENIMSGDTASTSPSPECNAFGIQVLGILVATMSEVPFAELVSANDGRGTVLAPNYTASNQIEYVLQDVKRNRKNIKALIVDINSPGGDAEAAQEIADAIRKFDMPSAAVIRQYGTSGGYISALLTDRIFARESSLIGSIGATNSFLNQSEKDKKEGIVYEKLSSGPYKDVGSPNKPLTDKERDLIMRDVKITHDNFVKWVSESRHLPIEQVEKLADGSTMLAEQALKNGLIDEIGGTPEAGTYLEQRLGEPVIICWQ